MINKPIDKIDFTFEKGKPLTSSQLNMIVKKINETIDIINKEVLGNELNLNREYGDMTKAWTLEQAIAAIPPDRKVPGMRITFLEKEGNWSSWTHVPEEDKWTSDEFNILDGGTW